MNLEAEILNANFKDQAMSLATKIGSDSALFAELMALYFSKETRSCQRAAWIVSHCANHNSDLLIPYIEKIIKNLDKGVGDATKRNTVRVLRFLDIPEELWGDIIEICFRYLNGREAIAIKVFPCQFFTTLALKYPKLPLNLKLPLRINYPMDRQALKAWAIKF